RHAALGDLVPGSRGGARLRADPTLRRVLGAGAARGPHAGQRAAGGGLVHARPRRRAPPAPDPRDAVRGREPRGGDELHRRPLPAGLRRSRRARGLNDRRTAMETTASTGNDARATALPRAASPGWTLALTSVAFFMVALDTLVVVTALPAIRREL